LLKKRTLRASFDEEVVEPRALEPYVIEVAVLKEKIKPLPKIFRLHPRKEGSLWLKLWTSS
jgi:hypothetical protein